MPHLILALPDPPPAVVSRLAAALLRELGALRITCEFAAAEADLPARHNTVAVAICTASAVPARATLGALPTVTLLVGADEPGDELADLVCASATICATDDDGVHLLERLGRTARRVHCGYSAAWDRRPRFEHRDIDAIVHVPPSQAAHAAAAALARHLDRVEHRVLIDERLGTAAAMYEELDGTSLTELLHRTRVFVSLTTAGSSSVPAFEATLAGCAIVATHGARLAPLRAGRDLLSASIGNIPHVLSALLEDDPLRIRLAGHALLTLRLDVPMRRAAEALYDAAAEALHAPHATSQIAVAPSAEPRPDSASPTASTAPAPAKPMRSATPPQGCLHVGAASPGYAGALPEVSIVVAGSGEAYALASTLSSIADMQTIGCSEISPLEVVIVQDTPSSGDAARWVRSNPRIAALAVEARPARGLPALRRSAIELARARLCLLLAPGTKLTPHALPRLVRALECVPDAVAATGLIAVERGGCPVSLRCAARAGSDSPLLLARTANLQTPHGDPHALRCITVPQFVGHMLMDASARAENSARRHA